MTIEPPRAGARAGRRTKSAEAAGVDRVFLHVGMMKTGTTYLQSRLKEHRSQLAADGVVVPPAQLQAVRDRSGRRGTLNRPSVDGAWARLVKSLRTTNGHCGVVSMEFLSAASARTATGIVSELAPAEVHVVVTARDLSRVIAAQWQESIQNRAVWSWEDYSGAVVGLLAAGVASGASQSTTDPPGPMSAQLEAERQVRDWPAESETSPADHDGGADGWDDIDEVDDGDDGDEVLDLDTGADADTGTDPVAALRGRPTASTKFWLRQDVARVVQDWATAVGPDRVHLVTLPPPGSSPDILWHRFGRVIGVDASRYERTDEPIRTNTGLDLGAAEFLRRLNERLPSDVTRATYIRNVKHVLGKRALAKRGAAHKPQLTAEQYEVVVDHSHRLVEHFREIGVDVEGDLAELIPPPAPTASNDSTAGDLDAAVADAAIDAVLALINQIESPVMGARDDGAAKARPSRRDKRAQGRGGKRGAGRQARGSGEPPRGARNPERRSSDAASHGRGEPSDDQNGHADIGQ